MYLRRHHHQIGYPHLYRRIYLLQHNHHIDRYGRYRFRHLSLQITRPTDRTFPLRTDSSFKCNTIRILNPVRSHIHIRTYRRHCHDNIRNQRVLLRSLIVNLYRYRNREGVESVVLHFDLRLRIYCRQRQDPRE